VGDENTVELFPRENVSMYAECLLKSGEERGCSLEVQFYKRLLCQSVLRLIY
jgi:hypothetical protein